MQLLVRSATPQINQNRLPHRPKVGVGALKAQPDNHEGQLSDAESPKPH